MHRGVGGGHLDQRLGIGESLEIFVKQLVFAGFERSGEPFAIARGLCHEFDLFGAGFPKQDRFLATLDDRA